jgi:hypothetical protein
MLRAGVATSREPTIRSRQGAPSPSHAKTRASSRLPRLNHHSTALAHLQHSPLGSCARSPLLAPARLRLPAPPFGPPSLRFSQGPSARVHSCPLFPHRHWCSALQGAGGRIDTGRGHARVGGCELRRDTAQYDTTPSTRQDTLRRSKVRAALRGRRDQSPGWRVAIAHLQWGVDRMGSWLTHFSSPRPCSVVIVPPLHQILCRPQAGRPVPAHLLAHPRL